MRKFSLLVGCIYFLTVSAYANNQTSSSPNAFLKRFEIIRSSNGQLIGIRDRTLPVKFSVVPYVKMIKSFLKEEQSFMSQENLLNGEYENQVKNLMTEDMPLDFSRNNQEFNKNVQAIVDSLKKLASLNVDSVFSNASFLEVINQYQGKLNDAILLLDPTIIANVNDSTFFYKKNVTFKVVNWGLDFARKRLSSIPLLNTASFVIVEVEKLIIERRQFHQNMLLHYLENFKEQELGLTHDEVNLIWSSIYESRISWFAFWESNKAKNNWAKYGVNNFYAEFRLATNNLNRAKGLYSEVNERLNYAFQKVVFNNEKVIINLQDKENLFLNRPAIAFNFDRPTEVARKRILLNLAQLGLSFVPMSAMIKDNVTLFIKSFYEKQKITEGALYGYFESSGDLFGQNKIKSQYLNPFDELIFNN